MKQQVVLINYGAGNMASIRNALNFLDFPYLEIDSGSQPCPRDTVFILPGVGSFAQAAFQLRKRGLTDLIYSCPRVLGICLGMQLLFCHGEEGGPSKGLGLIDGSVRSIVNHPQYNNSIRLPHVGWQGLRWFSHSNTYSFSAKHDQEFYFVHSFMAYPSSPEAILAAACFGDMLIPSVVAHKNVVGFQFHPEKSGPVGLDLLDGAISWLHDQP